MITQKYNEVFEFIKSSLVPKHQLGESQNEIIALKSALENATNDLRKTKLEYEEQQLVIHIIRAEKESLEAENKTFQIKFNEISLKLKQKTNQYDSLLKSQNKVIEPQVIGKISTITQIIKEEPKGIVNVPSSSEPAAKPGTKRTHSSNDEVQRKIAKRRKTKRNQTENFSCEQCLDVWGKQIQSNYFGDPENSGVPDPKLKIPTFSSFRDFKSHQVSNHCFEANCHKENRCLFYSGHGDGDEDWPHGDIKCKICCLSFKFQKHHDEHMQFQHADIKTMDINEIYNLFLKYYDVWYNDL